VKVGVFFLVVVGILVVGICHFSKSTAEARIKNVAYAWFDVKYLWRII